MGVRERVGVGDAMAPVAIGFSDWKKEDTVCVALLWAWAAV